MSREIVIAKLNSKHRAFNERNLLSSNPISPQPTSPHENEDPFKKVLEKLESIEKRLSNIEHGMKDMRLFTPAASGEGITKEIQPNTGFGMKDSRLFTPAAASEGVTKEAQPNIGFGMKDLRLFTPAASSEGVTKEAQPNIAFGMKDMKLFTPASGSEGATKEIQANPFASSLLKFNLPIVGDWTKKETKNEDEEPEAGVVPTEELPIENTCNMKPIELKTGEENEEVLFEQRCKLYRFRDKEYKERGLGNIKILKDRKDGKGRLIMRRDQIGLVCLNCRDCSKIERVRETQVRWAAFDASDSDPISTVFLVRFKTPQLTDTFISHMQELFSDSQDQSSISTPKEHQSDVESSTNTKPDIELVNPKLDPQLVEKARELQLPDLFYHKLPNQEPCIGCDGCEKDD